MSGPRGRARGAALEMITGAEARAHWHRIAAAAPQSVGRLPLWADMLCASGRFTDATRAYRRPDGTVLVLPLVRRRLPPGPLALYESWPWGWDAGVDSAGLVAEGPVTADDVTAVAADLAALPAARVRVQAGLADGDAWAGAALPAWIRRSLTHHLVDLPAGGGPGVVEGLSRNHLRKLRKAERSFDIECDDTGRLLPVFQTLLQRSIDSWAEQHWLPPRSPAACCCTGTRPGGGPTSSGGSTAASGSGSPPTAGARWRRSSSSAPGPRPSTGAGRPTRRPRATAGRDSSCTSGRWRPPSPRAAPTTTWARRGRPT